MSDERIDLLPPIYGARARLRMLNRRIAMSCTCGALILVALVFHARVSRASAEDRLVEARERANEVLDAEEREKTLLAGIDHSGERIEAWRQVALPLPVGAVLVTMANTLPDEITLQDLQVDVTGVRVDSRGQRLGDRRLVGRLEGHAPDEGTVRLFVSRLRDRAPFESVRRGFTALVEQGDVVRTRFSVDFEVDLETPWKSVVGEDDDLVVLGGDS